MKRFFQDDPDDQNFLTPDDSDFDPESEMEEGLEAEFTAYINTEDFMNVMSMDLAEMKLNQQLLVTASKLARKGDWFWRFRSTETQLNKIEVVYDKLVGLLEKVAQQQHQQRQGEQQDGNL